MIRLTIEDLNDDKFNAGMAKIYTHDVTCIELLRKCCDLLKAYGFHQRSVEDAILELAEELDIDKERTEEEA